MKKYYLILFISLISFCSCNSSRDFTVTFESQTLTIDNLEAKSNTDYTAKIGLIEQNYNYRLPIGVTVFIGNQYIDSSEYTYNQDTGDIFIGKSLVKDNLKIVAERIVIDGYQVKFDYDEHVHYYFYPNRDYSKDPVEDTIAIARDLTGKPVMDGTGEVNFKYTIDENYDTDLVWMRGMCDEATEVETGIYRIANIKSNVRFAVATKKIYCKNLSASADYGGNSNPSFSFSWETKNPEKVDHFDIKIVHDSTTETATTTSNSYTYANSIVSEKLYKFTFTPVLKDGTIGDPITKDMMLSPTSKDYAFPRVDIFTEDNLLPPYEVAKSPTAFNTSVVNNKYIQNVIKIYDDTGTDTVVYDSSVGYEGHEFDGSKIKVRGNTSTVNSNGKESYKIKLDQKADLLAPFITRSEEPDAYKHKEWLLLNCGNTLNELGGFSLEKSLKMSWIPGCQYVTLFMNNDFKGLYILCEAVTKGNVSGEVQSRCPITDDGFIIENDPYAWEENLTFKTNIYRDAPYMEYTFKYPDADDLDYTSEEYIYISNYVKEFEGYFYNQDSRFKNYIDVDSFARWTIAHDMMHVKDQFGSNMYIYKKDDTNETKLTAGTTWDFDSAFIGNQGGAIAGLCYHRSSPFYYIMIFGHMDDFKILTQEIFDDVNEDIVYDFIDAISYINAKKDIYNDLLDKEALRFGTSQTYFDAQAGQIQNFLEVQIQFVKDNPYWTN